MDGTILFPDPRTTLDDGLLCVGGDLSVPTLYAAYQNGIFPWPQEGFPLLWFSPPRRGIIDFHELHVSRTMKRFLRRHSFEITVNKAFPEVIRECAQIPRVHEDGTWILPEMEDAYLRFHDAGYAHSLECWEEGVLVGGIYGVYVSGVFSGESMFYKRSNASKVCLIELIRMLSEQGLRWMDAQMVTPVLKAFGGKYIERDEFLRRLSEARDLPDKLDLQEPIRVQW